MIPFCLFILRNVYLKCLAGRNVAFTSSAVSGRGSSGVLSISVSCSSVSTPSGILIHGIWNQLKNNFPIAYPAVHSPQPSN